jgi:hypothetical protein
MVIVAFGIFCDKKEGMDSQKKHSEQYKLTEEPHRNKIPIFVN